MNSYIGMHWNKVSLKQLSVKEKQNALNEVRFLASINSPNVISYKQAFIDDESESLCIGKYDLCQMLYLYSYGVCRW